MGNVLYPLWAECPMLTRLVIVGYPAMSLGLMLVSSAGLEWLVDSLFIASIDNLKSFKLWTFLWGPFYSPLQGGPAFLMILFELYMAMTHFPNLEKELGSATFLFWMFLINALTSVVYLCFMFGNAMYYHGTAYESYYDAMSLHGLWPLVMVCLTLSSLSQPDGSTNFWGLVQIPNKWYPIALTAFFMLINGMKIMWNFVTALIVGYAYAKLRLERLLPSKTRADRLEQRCCRGGRCGFLGASWVAAVSTASFDTDSQIDRRYAHLSDFGRSAGQSTSSSSGGGGGGNFTAFAGAGNRLGEANETPAAPASAPSPAPAPETGTELASPPQAAPGA